MPAAQRAESKARALKLEIGDLQLKLRMAERLQQAAQDGVGDSAEGGDSRGDGGDGSDRASAGQSSWGGSSDGDTGVHRRRASLPLNWGQQGGLDALVDPRAGDGRSDRHQLAVNSTLTAQEIALMVRR